MTRSNVKGQAQISAVRQFNRFYTARLGLLRKRHLDGDFSLTEARVLYEISANPKLTASALRETLRLNAGYLSRSLTALTKRRLVRQTISKYDGRERLLMLSSTGDVAVARLNEQSELQIRTLLAEVNSGDRDELIESLSKIQSILGDPKRQSVRIVRLNKITDDAIRLLDEYYDAVNVVQRDAPEAIKEIIQDPLSGMWLAYLGEKPVGCVVLRKLADIPHASECKRLYVRPTARGHGLARKLLDVQENFARNKGLHWIYLDSYDDLKIAIALYRKRGYVSCKRYNDNPQATVFLRKNIARR